jgi:hypothetical protein
VPARSISCSRRRWRRWRGTGAGQQTTEFRVGIEFGLSLCHHVGRLKQNAPVLIHVHHEALTGVPGQDGAAASIGFDEYRFRHIATVRTFSRSGG